MVKRGELGADSSQEAARNELYNRDGCATTHAADKYYLHAWNAPALPSPLHVIL